MDDQFSFSQGLYDLNLTRELEPVNSDGVNGEVVQAKIGTPIWSLLGQNAPPNSTSEYFALKISRSGRKSEGKLEKEFLQELKRHNVRHRHLVVCYLCFECARSLYFVMDLAKGNLDDFMKTYPLGNTNTDGIASTVSGVNIEWLLRQMHGLAGALAAIHQPSENSIGWHHDIKPQNILYYGEEGHVWGKDGYFEFRITDWTTAKIRPKPSDYTIGSTDTGWPAYLPEETLRGPTACEPDIWSLGCVFLELLIWFNKGFDALDNGLQSDLGFRQLRSTISESLRRNLKGKLTAPEKASEADYNVFYTADGEPMKYVEMAIDSLDAEDEIRETRMSDLVRQMLKADPKDRPTAQDVRDELYRMCDQLALQNARCDIIHI